MRTDQKPVSVNLAEVVDVFGAESSVIKNFDCSGIK